MQDIRICFLGTAAGTPSRDRNVSGAALILDGTVLLFDCGEGTQHQLLRAPVRSGAIEAIFLSHLHGDHVYGLPGLLATMSMNSRSRALEVYGPAGLRDYIECTLRTTSHNPIFDVIPVEDSRPRLSKRGYRVESAHLDHTVPSLGWCVIEDDHPGKFDVERARALGIPAGPLFGSLQRGQSVMVGDRLIAPSEVLGEPRRGRRIAFVSDTRPCDAAIELARGADVLVHEATYAADLAAEAKERGHSTAEGAARVAAAAGVRRLILTHFSTRYGDVQPLVNEARAIFPATDAASDLAVFDV